MGQVKQAVLEVEEMLENLKLQNIIHILMMKI